MCGFVGVFGDQCQLQMQSAVDAIHHRGPDDSIIEKGEGWSIGFNRLAIIDLSDVAMQPFENERCIVFLNGEIYNYIELIADHANLFTPKSQSDVEIIPFLYEKYGINFLNKLNGMFSIALVDKVTGDKYLIRDRFAKKPLYYLKAKEMLVFGSEIKAIKKIVDLEADPASVLINMACWMVPPPIALYKHVKSIMPGSYLLITSDLSISEIKWYVPSLNDVTGKFSKEEFIYLLEDSVRLRTRSDVPMSLYLSGGLDSMSIAEIMRRNGADFSALTAEIIDKADLGGEGNTDIVLPTKFCKENNIHQIGCMIDRNYWNKNIIRIVKNYEEIFLDSGNLVFYRLGELARANNIKVAMAGVGGDEIFGGYPWHSKLFALPTPLRGRNEGLQKIENFIEHFISKMPHGLLRRKLTRLTQLYMFPAYFQATALGSFFVGDILDSSLPANDKLREVANKLYTSIANYPNLDWGNQVNLVNMGLTISNQNYKADMGSMAASVENRAPLLDYRLVEYMMCVPHEMKISKGHKSLFRESVKSILPPYITSAKKSGPTMPVNTWFQDSHLNEAKRFISTNQQLVGDFMGGEFVDHWCRDLSRWDGAQSKLPLFALISLTIWLKLNVQKLSIPDELTFSEIVEI